MFPAGGPGLAGRVPEGTESPLQGCFKLGPPQVFPALAPRHSVGHRVSNAECCSNPTLGCPPPRDYCSAGSGQGPGICISTSVTGVILEGCRPHFEDPTSWTRKVPPPRRSALCVRPPAFVCWASLGGSLDPSRPRPQFNGHPAPYSFGTFLGLSFFVCAVLVMLARASLGSQVLGQE